MCLPIILLNCDHDGDDDDNDDDDDDDDDAVSNCITVTCTVRNMLWQWH